MISISGKKIEKTVPYKLIPHNMQSWSKWAR